MDQFVLRVDQMEVRGIVSATCSDLYNQVSLRDIPCSTHISTHSIHQRQIMCSLTSHRPSPSALPIFPIPSPPCISVNTPISSRPASTTLRLLRKPQSPLIIPNCQCQQSQLMKH